MVEAGSQSREPRIRRALIPALLGGAFVFALALFLDAFRRTLTPDLQIDELIYASVGQNLAAGHGLVNQGLPFFWQPPLFFLIEWPVVSVMNLQHVNTLDAALQLRLMNAVIAGCTALAAFAVGWRVRGPWAALAAGTLFALDPYVLHLTRRLYLDPFAVLLVACALLVVLSSSGRWSWRRRLAVGLLIGLAALTKELAAYALLVPVLLWLRREMSWREPVTIAATAIVVYGVYPLWALISGNIATFLAIKTIQYQHLTGIVHFNSFGRPGAPLAQSLLQTAADYWPSYVCIALALPLTGLLWYRRERAARVLAAWSLASYVLIAALEAFHTVEDQFFLYLMVPVVCVLGYWVAAAIAYIRSPRRAMVRARIDLVAGVALLGVLALLAIPDAQLWWIRYGSGLDNGYTSLVTAIDAHVPPGSTIDSPGGSSEELKFLYPKGPYGIVQERIPQLLRRDHIHWFILRSKDIDLSYITGVDRPYYDYIVSHARLVWGVYEHTYYDFGLWYVADPQALPDVSFPIAPIRVAPEPVPQ